MAQSPVSVEIKLTESQIVNFIAAQKDMAAYTEKAAKSATEKPDPKTQAELEKLAKRFGFSSFSEYDDVAATIAFVMQGVDPVTKEYVDPRITVQKEIDEVRADKSISEGEKKRKLAELNEFLKVMPPPVFGGNVMLIKKYFDKIEKALQ